MFIFGDMTVFALFFATFIYYRAGDPAGFAVSQLLLNQNLGVINTLLLLASSWFVIMGVDAARKELPRWPTRMLLAAFSCGVGFALVKYIEYGEKIQLGYTPASSEFFMLYFVFTGIHLVHVVLGLGVLAVLIRHTKAVEARSVPLSTSLLESGACYWHMVDLLWIVLFPLIYMVA